MSRIPRKAVRAEPTVLRCGPNRKATYRQLLKHTGCQGHESHTRLPSTHTLLSLVQSYSQLKDWNIFASVRLCRD